MNTRYSIAALASSALACSAISALACGFYFELPVTATPEAPLKVATKAPIPKETKTALTAFADEKTKAADLIKELPPKQMPASISELQRRTYTEFEKSMDNGMMRMIPPPGHYLPPHRNRYLLDGATLDFTAAYPADHPFHGKWKIENVQLLGMLKDTKGVVYDVKKDEYFRLTAASFKTPDESGAKPRVPAQIPSKREMDTFEKAALANLQKDDNLQAQADGDHLRVLGAIRALGNNCTSCHKVEKTHLMGALSYDLKRVK